MKQDQEVLFIVGLLKLEPELLTKPESDLFKTIDGVFAAIYNKRATREYVRLAVARFKGNTVKRKWSLKFRYAIALFLNNPTMATPQALKLLRERFTQRTRPTVVESARSEANKIPR